MKLALTANTAYEDVVANEAVVGVNVVEFAADAVIANEAVVANDAVAGVNVILVAALAVVANDEDITFCAQLLVPNNDPVIPDVTPKLPVIANEPDVVNEPLKMTISVVVINDPVIT